jgi:hypothetical protein
MMLFASGQIPLYQRQEHAWNQTHEWIATEFTPAKSSIAIGSMAWLVLAQGWKGLGHPQSVVDFCEHWIALLYPS